MAFAGLLPSRRAVAVAQWHAGSQGNTHDWERILEDARRIERRHRSITQATSTPIAMPSKQTARTARIVTGDSRQAPSSA